MAVMSILQWPDPFLSRICAPVTAFDAGLAEAASDMLETMYHAQGRGLAAPQVGRNLRMFVMDIDWKTGHRKPWVCVNPSVQPIGADMVTNDEGCLSIPGVLAAVTRPSAVRLDWTDLEGDRHQADLSGFAAICAQHELDHLDGIVTFDRIGAAERAAVEGAYSA